MGPQTPAVIAAIDHALAVWSVPEEPYTYSAEGDSATDAPTEPSDVPSPVLLPANAAALLNQMRRTQDASTGPRRWRRSIEAVAHETVPRLVAKELLRQATRLLLDGEALGTIAAIAARAGLAEEAAGALADALAHTPAYGWLQNYGGGSRLGMVRAAMLHRDPTIARLANRDLAGALSTGALSGQIRPDDLSRILETIAGDRAVAIAWPQVEEHLNTYAPAAPEVPDLDNPIIAADTPVETLMRWVAGYLGHPVRSRDFGARRVLEAGLAMALPQAQAVLAESIRIGGWQAEAALHTLVMLKARPVALPPTVAEAIVGATQADDAICRDLARHLCARHGFNAAAPPKHPLARMYELMLPALPARAVPELDRRGVPMIDMHDPQQILAPFDVPLRLASSEAGLAEEAVLHRAATIAVGLEEPWLRGGHQAHADRLQRRGQHHTYRPWAFMAGRRALGIVVAELVDADAFEPEITAPAYELELIDEALVQLVAKPLDDTTPAPWRAPTEASYETRGWCKQTEDAAQAYATSVEAASTYVLAESTEWVRLEWGKPEERRSIKTAHGPAEAGGVILPSRQPWETSFAVASGYPGLGDLAWVDEQLVVEGFEMHTDPPWHRWLALHPAVGQRLGWTPNPTEIFRWNGDDGAVRANTIRRVRGQLSHQPPSRAYCAEGWQVVLSDKGLADLRRVFGPLRRGLHVRRTLPARSRDDRPTEVRSHRIPLTEPR